MSKSLKVLQAQHMISPDNQNKQKLIRMSQY